MTKEKGKREYLHSDNRNFGRLNRGGWGIYERVGITKVLRNDTEKKTVTEIQKCEDENERKWS